MDSNGRNGSQGAVKLNHKGGSALTATDVRPKRSEEGHPKVPAGEYDVIGVATHVSLIDHVFDVELQVRITLRIVDGECCGQVVTFETSVIDEEDRCHLAEFLRQKGLSPISEEELGELILAAMEDRSLRVEVDYDRLGYQRILFLDKRGWARPTDSLELILRNHICL